MIELELFYNKAVSSIREEQAEYLKRQKREPFTQELPEVLEAKAEDYVQYGFWARVRYYFYIRKQRRRYRKALRAQKRPVDERLTKGYNAGMESALKVLESEFKAFEKRMKKDEEI